MRFRQLAGTLRRLRRCAAPGNPAAPAPPGGVKLFVPPGHFYSPVVDPSQLASREAELFREQRPLPGIDLNEAAQCALAEQMREPYRRLWFPAEKSADARYFYRNGNFSYADAVTLACLLQILRPRTMIEVGSGYSSALTLDIVERCLDWSTSLTFIEPYPDLLNSLTSETDRGRIEIIASPVQAVPPAVFDRLGEGDILFIDSTHVVKSGSDVLHHFDEVLPRLRPGVIIHIHDIFYPFEYPRAWVMEMNLSWNELYYVRAFLTNNPEYEIVFFNDFMRKRHFELMRDVAPLFLELGGSSLWLRKKAVA